LQKNKVDLAQAQANALANEDKVQHAEMKKELSNRAYIRASQKAQQIAETARIRQNQKNQMEASVEEAEKELEDLKLETVPAVELLQEDEVVMLN